MRLPGSAPNGISNFRHGGALKPTRATRRLLFFLAFLMLFLGSPAESVNSPAYVERYLLHGVSEVLLEDKEEVVCVKTRSGVSAAIWKVELS